MTNDTDTKVTTPSPAERLTLLPVDGMMLPLGWRIGADSHVSTLQSLWDEAVFILQEVPDRLDKYRRRFTGSYNRRRTNLDRISRGDGASRAMWRISNSLEAQRVYMAKMEAEVAKSKERISVLEKERDEATAAENARHRVEMEGWDVEVQQDQQMLDDAIMEVIESIDGIPLENQPPHIRERAMEKMRASRSE